MRNIYRALDDRYRRLPRRKCGFMFALRDGGEGLLMVYLVAHVFIHSSTTVHSPQEKAKGTEDTFFI
jgi:hypothetical protein